MATALMQPYHLTQWGMLGRCTISDKQIVRSVELESVRTKVSVRGFVAQVKATLIYHNIYDNPLEVECEFPVDEGAAFYKFEAHLDGRTIIAQCMEKKKAEKVYKKAVSQGKTAVLAREHEHTSDILQLALGNLPSGARAEIEVCLVMELNVHSDGGVSFILPTVLNPRYSPADLQHKDSPLVGWNNWSTQKTVFVSKTYSMDIEGSVCGSHQIARIISHTDPINVAMSEDTKSAQITQDGGFKCDHDWSMVVYYNNPYKTHVLRETSDRSGAGIMKDDLLMVNFFPCLPDHSYSNRNEIIFVIDRSGSMHGAKILSARSTLLLFLKSLPQGCYFNIVSFGSHFTTLFPEGSQQYMEETLLEACRLQETMNADMGGTEILQPLKSIYSIPPKPEYSRQILLMSDGQVFNVSQVTELVARNSFDTRVFSVGIGHGASTALIHGVARAGRGRYEMVVDQDKLQHKVMGIVRSMLQESVQGVSVNCRVEPATRVSLVPKVPLVIFGGQHLILYACITPDTTVCEVTVKGSTESGGEVKTSVLEEDVVRIHDGEMSLHRLAARAQINHWQLQGDDEVGDEMVALSLASGVVSPRTALIGVDQESGPIGHNYLPSQPPCKPVHRALSRGISRPRRNAEGCHGQEARGVTNLNSSLLRKKRGLPQIFGLTSSAKDVMPVRQRSRLVMSVTSSEDEKDYCCLDASRLICAPQKMHDTDAVEVFGSGSSGLLKIVQLQKFDGSWSLEDAATLTGVTFGKLKAANTAKSEVAFGTAVVVALLEKQFSGDRDQWTLLTTKARSYITAAGEDAHTLITLARSLLDAAL